MFGFCVESETFFVDKMPVVLKNVSGKVMLIPLVAHSLSLADSISVGDAFVWPN